MITMVKSSCTLFSKAIFEQKPQELRQQTHRRSWGKDKAEVKALMLEEPGKSEI